MTFSKYLSSCLGLLLALMSLTALAQSGVVKVENAWVRPAVAGQSGTGAFMRLTAPSATQLVRVSTPVAAVAEVHEMKMQGDIMTMRPLAALDLPAGKTVELKPGGYHLMLMDLKAALPAGSPVPLTLYFKDARGQTSQLQLTVKVGVPARP